jgi:hypothetical protein
MRYNTKPVAVRSENILSNLKASNGARFNGDGSSTIIFDVPAMTGGFYLDPHNTRLTFNLLFTDNNNVASGITNGNVYLDRGPHSLINRLQVYDANGHPLEDITDYHQLYAMMTMVSGNPMTRATRGSFYKDCRYAGQNNVTSAGDSYFHKDTATVSAQTGVLISGTFPDPTQGGRVLSMGTAVSGATNFYGTSLMQNGTDGPVATTLTQPIQLSLNLISGIFGSGFPKYYPLSAMNGLRIVLTLNRPAIAFQMDHLCNNGTGVAATLAYSVSDPTLYMNSVRVDPSVDRGLISSMRGRDGKIRIPTVGWRSYKISIYPSDTVKNFIVPFAVSSLKSLFWCFSPATPDGTQSASAMYTRNLAQYQCLVGTIPIPVTPVQVIPPYCEAMSELYRAVHVTINDQSWPGLIKYSDCLNEMPTPYSTGTTQPSVNGTGVGLGPNTLGSFNQQSDIFFGVELESFSGKNDTIECGANVLNNNIELRFTFNSIINSAIGIYSAYNCYVYGYHDVFIVMDPLTGVTTLEF